MFKGMTYLERGAALWARAGDMDIAEAVAAYGGIHEAAEAALEVLQEDPDFEYSGDAAADLRAHIEHAIES